MRDEIIEEVWRIKDEIAKEHGNDLAAIVAYLQRREEQEGLLPADDGTPGDLRHGDNAGQAEENQDPS